MDFKKDPTIPTDTERKCFRVWDVVFANGEEDNVHAVLNELMDCINLAPALMTARAMAQYICYPDPVPEYLCKRMERMDLGETITYSGVHITKHTDHLYNSKKQ